MASWASISETQSYTGIAVSQDHIDMAQAMIELFADVIYDQSDKISTKNLRLLKMAVAYQAAWIVDHPDLFTHTDVTSINQDGIFYVHAHENAYLIAPMARRALKRLSWMRNKSIRVRPSTNRLISKKFVDGSNYDSVSYSSDEYPGYSQDYNENGLNWGEL